jgi:hypothetical protein
VGSHVERLENQTPLRSPPEAVAEVRRIRWSWIT